MWHCNDLHVLSKGAMVLNLTVALLLFCVMFLTFPVFVEPATQSRWYVFIAGGLSCCLAWLLATRVQRMGIDLTTTLVAVFMGYLLLASCWSPLAQGNVRMLSVVSFFLLCFSFRQISRDYLGNMDVVILAACVAQACYGLVRHGGIFRTCEIFGMSGSFDNPAGFSACLVAGFPFCLSVARKGGWRRCLGAAALTIVVASIILSGSRAGVVAVVAASCACFAHCHPGILRKYRKCFVLSCVVLLFAGAGLLFLKKDSAMGRVLVWKNSCAMIVDRPVWGGGPGAFRGSYMQYQAGCFERDPGSRYSMLADNVTHPFNEYLLLAIEYGISGMLLFLVAVFAVVRRSRQLTVHHLGLLSIGIFACFSYPLRYPFVLIIMAYCLGNVETKDVFTVKVNAAGKVAGAVVIGFFSLVLARDVQFAKRWGQLVEKSNFGNYEKILDDYGKLYSTWNVDPLFLYNYGAVLNRAGSYGESAAVLSGRAGCFDNYDVRMVMADNCFKLGQWDKAEVHWLVAHDMIPNRFVPLYRLMLLYEAAGDKYKLLRMANVIVGKSVKVPSETVSLIKKEAKGVIDNALAEGGRTSWR